MLSAGKRLPHYYFRQTDRSRALGNRSAAGLFDFQQNCKYVVGPGSRLADGRTYDVVNDAPLADFPDWLADFIEAHSKAEKSFAGTAHPVSEDFDIDDMLTHYDLGYDIDGDLYITDVCPVAGRTRTLNAAVEARHSSAFDRKTAARKLSFRQDLFLGVIDK